MAWIVAASSSNRRISVPDGALLVTWVSCVEERGTPMTYLPISALLLIGVALAATSVISLATYGLEYCTALARSGSMAMVANRMSARPVVSAGMRFATASGTN